MICSLYKPTLRSRRWYVYLWLHSLTIAVVNAWFLYRRNTQWIDPQEKTKPLRTFQANVASNLVSAKRRTRGRPSTESKLTRLSSKLVKVESAPMPDIRLVGIDHMFNWNEKSCRQYLDGYTCVPAVNEIPCFVSTKVETVPKVIMDIRKMLRMFETKPALFKVNNTIRNTRT